MGVVSTSDATIEGLRAALEVQSDAPTLRAWLGLASGELSFDEYYNGELSRRWLPFLTVDTTGACDLVCRDMCYYHPKIVTTRKPAPETALRDAIRDTQRELGLKALVFSGKEPFLNAELLFALSEYAASIKKGDFVVGAVTNGRHVARHWDVLSSLAAKNGLDFLDISIDSGFAEQHDAIRGVEGTFARAFSAVEESAARLGGVRISVSSVLREDNAAGILELIRRAAGCTPYFNIQPIQPPPFAVTKPLSLSELFAFVRSLATCLESELAGRGLEILVALHGLYVHEAVRQGFFRWEDLRENADGQTYAIKQVSGNCIVFNAAVLPEYGWRQARITYTGAYLAYAHFLQTPDPEKFAIGYVQEEPILALYERAKQEGGHAHQLLQARRCHDCLGRPCWTSCFGGWTASENSILTNHSLEAKPALCLKTAADFCEVKGTRT